MLWTVGCLASLGAAALLRTADVIGWATFLTLAIGTVSSVDAAAIALAERRQAWLAAHPRHPFRERLDREHERTRLVDRYVVERAVLAGMSDRLVAAEIDELGALLPRDEAEFHQDEHMWAKRIGRFSERYVELCSRARVPVEARRPA